MFRKLAVLGSVAVLALGVYASDASSITIDGSLADWGITDITNGKVTTDGVNNPITGTYTTVDSYTVSYWEENGVRDDGWVQPGWGGQQFDIEGLYLTYDSSYIYVAATVGIPQDGSVAPNTGYFIGDLALSFDGSYNASAAPVYGFEYGIETRGLSAGALFSVGTWETATSFPASNPYNLKAATLIASSQGFSYTKVDNQPLYVIETMISRTGLSITGPVTVSLTQSCGNDSGRLTASVPEPSTLLLLGSGLLGLAGLNRRKKSC